MTLQKFSVPVTTSLVLGALILLCIPSSALAAVLPLLNAGFETAGTATSTAANWQPYQNGYARITTQHHTGLAALQLTNTTASQTKGAAQRIDLNQTSVQPVFIGGYIKGQNIQMRPGSYFGASVYVEIHLTDGSVMYWNSLPTSGTFDWRWVGFSTGSGFTTATSLLSVTKPIAYIFVVPILSGASGTAYFDDLTVIQDTPTQSAVTIMFDDSLDNHYMVAKPLMDALGFKGTLAVITGTLGQAGSLTMQNLKTFQSAGWEISSHSINHEDITTLTTARATREIVNSYQTLKNNGFTVTDFVYPYGAFNANLNAIGSPYYKSMRSFQAGNNPQGVYPYDVKVRQVTNATTASDVAAWVAEGKANKKWEVLVFHAVTASSDDIYYTDPTVFKNMLDAIKASGVPVVTYAQGVSLFAQKP